MVGTGATGPDGGGGVGGGGAVPSAEPPSANSIEALVAAQSRLVADFSREIAEAVKKLVEEKPASDL